MDKKQKRYATVLVGGKARVKETSNKDLNQIIQFGHDKMLAQFGDGNKSTFWEYSGKYVKNHMKNLLTKKSIGSTFYDIRTGPKVKSRKITDKIERKDLLERFA